MNRRLSAARHFLPSSYDAVKEQSSAFAPVNIALVKYWGKKDEELHIPITDSLSVALNVGSTTTIRRSIGKDEIFLNGSRVEEGSPFWKRATEFLHLFRPQPSFYFCIETINDVPTAAGLASSASGFAALTIALNDFFGWNLSPQQLSCLARLGSGSACRSLFSGFVVWQKGKDANDSYAVPWNNWWPELRFGLLVVSQKEKAISSREAMKNTVLSSPLYAVWPDQVAKDIHEVQHAIEQRDMDHFGSTVERNALIMHATMFAASPPICFWLPETVAYLQKVWEARRQKISVYATIDAGPNVKLLYPASAEAQVHNAFPTLQPVALLPPQ